MRFYVYELIDPLTDRAFYIGKGTGNRCQQHFHKPSLKADSVKNSVIRKRQSLGLKIEIRKVGLFARVEDAHDFETELICSAPAGSLANYKDGNGYKKFEHLRPDPKDFSMELRI